tara:strand:+ start:9601 stop:9879 length:279 start_codon:yes stop_codon:yes gene_type:complete
MKYTMTLEHCPNPDISYHSGYWQHPINKKPIKVSKNTLKEMRGEFYKWREENGLGGGNMGFIDVINQKNKQIGYFGYNGRFWRSKNPLNKGN